MTSDDLLQIKVIQERNELYQRKLLLDQERKQSYEKKFVTLTLTKHKEAEKNRLEEALGK